MIAPLPQSSQPLGDASGTRSGGSEPAVESFAGILAAAGTPRAPSPAEGADHAPIPDASVPEAIPGAALVDPALSVAPAAGGEASSAARIFNQFGFFASSDTAGDGPETSTLLPAEPPSSAPEAGAAGAAAPPQPAFSLRSAQAGNIAVRRAVATPKTVIPPARIAARAGPASPALRPATEIVTDAPESMARPSRRLPLRDGAARVTLQVVLREIEQGIHVAARVGALDASEREAMRDEILALLSRHGLAPRGVRIAAPMPAPSQERNR